MAPRSVYFAIVMLNGTLPDLGCVLK